VHGDATPPEDCAVDFTARRSPPYVRSPSPSPAQGGASARIANESKDTQQDVTRVERASPTYEPYQGRCSQPPSGVLHGEALYHSNDFSNTTPVNCGSEEWPWNNAQARAQDEVYQARKARQAALDARVAELQADEAREKEQRAVKRKVLYFIALKLSKNARAAEGASFVYFCIIA
jgi:hypothetical protein